VSSPVEIALAGVEPVALDPVSAPVPAAVAVALSTLRRRQLQAAVMHGRRRSWRDRRRVWPAIVAALAALALVTAATAVVEAFQRATSAGPQTAAVIDPSIGSTHPSPAVTAPTQS
jgi:hypothetical protein